MLNKTTLERERGERNFNMLRQRENKRQFCLSSKIWKAITQINLQQ